MNLQQAKIIKKKQLTTDCFELLLKVEEEFSFIAGQFITIKIADQVPPCFRAYSIVSPPRTDNIFILCIKVIENGRGSNWLYSRQIDDILEFIAPNGHFTFKTAPSKPVLFIATGTGVAPFISIIQDQLRKNNQQHFHLISGFRHQKNILYQDIFQNLEKSHPNFKYTVTLSRPENSWQGAKGRVTDILQKLDISPSTESYICGLNAMVQDCKKILMDKGLDEDSIHFEKYD